jgi:hypothetical protein
MSKKEMISEIVGGIVGAIGMGSFILALLLVGGAW